MNKNKNNKKVIVFVNLFGLSNENRIEPVSNYFSSHDYRTLQLITNFNHFTKTFDNNKVYGKIKIHVPAYLRNLSFKRFLSHFVFSVKAFFILYKLKPAIIYLKIPSNSILFILFPLKKIINCRIIVDVFDLWPESIPIYSLKVFLLILSIPFSLIRKFYLSNADLVLIECYLYQEVLKLKRFSVYYLLRTSKRLINEIYLPIEKNTINFCFLGGINSLVNIKLIISFFQILQKNLINFHFHIIGDGNHREQLISLLITNNINYTFHGVIFDQTKIDQILTKIHFGLNLIKPGLLIGLTLKSVDYLKYGIPLINNVSYDTHDMINLFSIGFNITDYTLNDLANKISSLKNDHYNELRTNSFDFFQKTFSNLPYSLAESFRLLL